MAAHARVMSFESAPRRVLARRAPGECLRFRGRSRRSFRSSRRLVSNEPRFAGERRRFPQLKSAAKGVGVIARSTIRRQSFELLHIAPAEHGFVGLQRRDEARYNVGDVAPPPLLAVAHESRPADIILVGALLVRQVAKLHRLHDAIDDDGRSKPGSKAQKEHLAAPVASQRLHGGVVDNFHGAAKCSSEIETDPPAPQVIGLHDRPAADDRAGIADRHGVIVPIFSELLDL